MIAATFFASGAVLLPANLSAAPASDPPPLEECDESPIGLPVVERRNLDKYSGYYRFTEKTFWHIMSSSGRLYILLNDSFVRPINQNSKYQFCYGVANTPNLFFNFDADGVPQSIRLHVNSYENYVTDDKGVRSQVQTFPARDIILPRIEKDIALSVYEKIQSDRQNLAASRAPRPAQLSHGVEQKIKSYITDQIDVMNKFDPYSFAEGRTQSVEYLGRSPQGEEVLKVTRDRSVRYWRVLLDPKGQVIGSSASLSL